MTKSKMYIINGSNIDYKTIDYYVRSLAIYHAICWPPIVKPIENQGNDMPNIKRHSRFITRQT